MVPIGSAIKTPQHGLGDGLVGADPKAGPAGHRAKRYDLEREVLIFHARTKVVAGVTISMSGTGLAVRVGPPLPDAEPVDLQPGEEVVVQGLVDVPVESWVIDHSGGIVRMHFMATPTAHEQIERLIDALEARDRRTHEAVAPVAVPRRFGRKTTAALVIVPVVAAVAIYGSIAAGLLQPSDLRERLADHVADPGSFGSLSKPKGSARDIPAVVLGEGAEKKLPSGRVQGATIYRLSASTYFPARIVSVVLPDGTPGIEADLDSDLRDDTRSGRVLLPHGTKLIGRLAHGGERPERVLGIFWTKVLLPNGKPLKFTFVGNGPDQAAANLADAPLVTLGQPGPVGARLLVQLNRDLALPAYDDEGAGSAR